MSVAMIWTIIDPWKPNKSYVSKSVHYTVRAERSRQQAEVIQTHENANVRNIGQGETRHRKYKRLKLGGGQAYDRSSE
jgi:hypothetical protein